MTSPCFSGLWWWKEYACMQETWVWSLGWGDSPGEGNGNPLQYSCLENPMDGGAWWARVHGSQRVGHDWKTSLSKDHLKVECQLCCKTILIVVKWSLIDRPHLDWEELQRSTTHSRWGHPMQTHDLGFPKNDDCYVQTWFFNCPWKQCPWDKMKYLDSSGTWDI